MSPRPLRRVRRLLLGALLLAPAGCDSPLGPGGEVRLTLHVAPWTAPCTGEGARECLLVREDPVEEWRYLYDPIEGFTHEPGFAYTLRVARLAVADPPADGSRFAYRLLRVVLRKPAGSP